MRICQILIIAFFIYSCNTQVQHEASQVSTLDRSEKTIKPKVELKQINYTNRDLVSSGLQDRNGNLWFTTSRDGVYKYDGISFTNFKEEDGLCSNEVFSVLEDKNGILWFGTSDGLCTYKDKKFAHIPIPWNGMKGAKTVLCLFQDKDEFIWLGTWGGGAYRYDEREFTSFLKEAGLKQPDGLYSNVIRNIIQDSENNIWISSLSHGGITRYDGETFVNYTEKDGLCDDMAFCSFIDSKGNMWLGGNEEGVLCRYDGKSFTHYTKSDGLCDGFVSCFYEDNTGNIWMGSEAKNSLCIFDGKNFTPFSIDGGDEMPAVRFIFGDTKGNIWMGGRYGSLYRYDGRELKDFTYEKRNE